MEQTGAERSLGELFSDLSKEMQQLLRQEVELAKAELSVSMKNAVKDIAFLFVGGAIIYAGFLALVTALIFGIGTGMPLWLAALIVGVVIIAIGYYYVQKGLKDLKQQDFKPRQTLSTFKEDIRWAKQQI